MRPVLALLAAISMALLSTCTGGGRAGNGGEACGDGECPECGDAVCEREGGWEDCDSCPDDCGACGVCGDGACSPGSGEDCATCAPDCGYCPGCDDGTCDVAGNETCASCPMDCGSCESCGDEECDPANGETCSTCEEDCGPCDECGDGECDPDLEDCATCADDCACETRAGCNQGDFEAFWGNLHAHTHYSDGEATPAVAFAQARAAGLDFMWVSDHREGLTETEFTACRRQADAATDAGAFIAGCGYEMSIENSNGTKLGHLNALFTTRLRSKPTGLAELYDWLDGCSPCVGQWNHPPGPGTFDAYRFVDGGRSAMRLIEMSGHGSWDEKAGAYFTAVRKGWLVSPSNNEDNHSANWGDSSHATGVWASDLGRYRIRRAVHKRRTFSAGDDTASIKMMADGVCWMGSVLEGLGPTTLRVEARDRQSGDRFDRIELYRPDRTMVDSHACAGANPCSAFFSREVSGATFFVAIGYQEDGDKLVSAPIWYLPAP